MEGVGVPTGEAFVIDQQAVCAVRVVYLGLIRWEAMVNGTGSVLAPVVILLMLIAVPQIYRLLMVFVEQMMELVVVGVFMMWGRQV